MTNRTPLILIDVDGVLNPAFSSSTRGHRVYREGWVQKKIDVAGLTFRVVINPDHGSWLLKLAEETGAELAWGTTWTEDANRYIGPLVGLPRLPVAPVPPGIRHKADGFVPWTAGRPFLWFDDEPDAASVTARLAVSQPHKVIWVDERVGLTRTHIDYARDWLKSIAG